MLFSEASRCRRHGKPLRSAFDYVAERTRRQPNSVRNHFYARLKDGDCGAWDIAPAAFVPFENEETEALVREILTAKANGESVRACTLRLANGDTKLMLRFQNKYRAILKRDPSMLKRIAEELNARGIPAGFESNDFRSKAISGTRAGEADAAISLIASLAKKAGEVDALTERIRFQEKENESQRERFRLLQTMFSRLAEVSRALAAAVMGGSLSPEARAELLGGIDDCEKIAALIG